MRFNIFFFGFFNSNNSLEWFNLLITNELNHFQIVLAFSHAFVGLIFSKVSGRIKTGFVLSVIEFRRNSQKMVWDSKLNEKWIFTGIWVAHLKYCVIFLLVLNSLFQWVGGVRSKILTAHIQSPPILSDSSPIQRIAPVDRRAVVPCFQKRESLYQGFGPPCESPTSANLTMDRPLRSRTTNFEPYLIDILKISAWRCDLNFSKVIQGEKCPPSFAQRSDRDDVFECEILFSNMLIQLESETERSSVRFE